MFLNLLPQTAETALYAVDNAAPAPVRVWQRQSPYGAAHAVTVLPGPPAGSGRRWHRVGRVRGTVVTSRGREGGSAPGGGRRGGAEEARRREGTLRQGSRDGGRRCRG